VLPFANLCSDKENEYFGDGLADEIITLLTRIAGLRVTARTSSFAFRAREQDVRRIGRMLGVSTVLEGSVQRTDGRIRVSAQLVDAANGFHLWSEQFDRKAGDVFAIQDEISQAIAHALEVRLACPRKATGPRNQEAYNCWLKARYYRDYEHPEAASRCRESLERAIALDPEFPQPYLGLAELARFEAEIGVVRPSEAITNGWKAIGRALELDDSLGLAHALRGAYRAWKDFDWPGSCADFTQALQLAPGSAEARRLFAIHYLVPTGRLGEAGEQMQSAVELDPVSPLAYIELGKVLLWARQFEAARRAMEGAFELRPDYWLAVWYRGVALYFQGRIAEALTIWQSVRIRTPAGIGAIGMALGQVGRHREARAALTELDTIEREHYVPQLSRAQIYLGLGDKDAAFKCLDRAVRARDPHILDLPRKPIWDELRQDPRFASLLRAMNLA
jgi:TolB-like protein